MTEPNDTTQALMEVTDAALCDHGCVSLHMQDIADESSRSKATLHYHYESKQVLRYALLEFLTDSFAERIETLEEFRTALLEAGRAKSVFRDDIDSDAVAEFIVTVLNGAQVRHVAVDYPPDRTYETLETYVSRQLLADDPTRTEVGLE